MCAYSIVRHPRRIYMYGVTANTRMVNQNWWITTLMINSHEYCPPLTKDIKCDVLIVGGGFSGISAAAEFLRKGLSVVLIEKNIVGGSSSGRSAGFLTPDSELELHQLVRRYGTTGGRGNLGSALPRHRPHRRHAEEARHPMRVAEAGLAVSRTRRRRHGGRRSPSASAARASASPISASTTRVSCSRSSARRATPRASATAARTASIRCSACRG